MNDSDKAAVENRTAAELVARVEAKGATGAAPPIRIRISSQEQTVLAVEPIPTAEWLARVGRASPHLTGKSDSHLLHSWPEHLEV